MFAAFVPYSMSAHVELTTHLQNYHTKLPYICKLETTKKYEVSTLPLKVGIYSVKLGRTIYCVS